jgi:hypothetical protein
VPDRRMSSLVSSFRPSSLWTLTGGNYVGPTSDGRVRRNLIFYPSLPQEVILPVDIFFPPARVAQREPLARLNELETGKRISVDILARIDPATVKASSPVHAERLLNVLDRVCAI